MQQVVTSAREIKTWKWQWFVPYGDNADSLLRMYLGFFSICSLDLSKAIWGVFVCFFDFIAFVHLHHSKLKPCYKWKYGAETTFFSLHTEWEIHCADLQLPLPIWRCSRTKGHCHLLNSQAGNTNEFASTLREFGVSMYVFSAFYFSINVDGLGQVEK